MQVPSTEKCEADGTLYIVHGGWQIADDVWQPEL